MSQGKVVKVSGPLVVASGMEEANMFDVVHVGDQGLIGEIIEDRKTVLPCYTKEQNTTCSSDQNK